MRKSTRILISGAIVLLIFTSPVTAASLTHKIEAVAQHAGASLSHFASLL